MHAKKRKTKQRRRARKLADQAWAAAEEGNGDLAVKIIRRAVQTQPGNPVLWNDAGLLLQMQGDLESAAESCQSAVSLAPDFAEPYAHLAAIRVRQQLAAEAVNLQEQAVARAPQSADYAQRLQAYRALLPAERPLVASTELPAEAWPQADGWNERVAALAWTDVEQQLTEAGWALLPELLDAASCRGLRELFDHDELFAETVTMNKPQFGRGRYRYFRAPLPSAVQHVRAALYPRLAPIVNRWQALLGSDQRYPEVWDAFGERCRSAGQHVPTPILIRYTAGGFNALHRDIRGEVYFPVQLAIVLSPRAEEGEPPGEGFRGGEFLLCDVPQRKKARRVAVPAGEGDAVLFCTRDRPIRFAGGYALQPVMHGAAEITAGTRYVLGVPFHEYR